MRDESLACSQIADTLLHASAVTLVCHTRPDADTVGSALALGGALRDAGVSVEVGVPGPVAIPSILTQLPGADLIVSGDAVIGHPVVVVLDCANRARVGDLDYVLAQAKTIIVVDHHASNSGFGDVDYIVPEADCTAELVLTILDAMGLPVNKDTATCIYAGLVTDTGSFRWARPLSHAVAARLLETGVDGQSWTRQLLDTHSFDWLSMVSQACSSAVLVPEAFDGQGLVYAVVDQRWASIVSWEEMESVIDLIRSVGDADVAVIFKASGDNRWTVSMRARAITNLVPLATSFGGGGHPHAAGFSVDGDIDAAIAALREVV